MTGQVQLDAAPFSVFTQDRFLGGGDIETDLSVTNVFNQLIHP